MSIDINFPNGVALVVGGSGGVGSVVVSKFVKNRSKVVMTYFQNKS